MTEGTRVGTVIEDKYRLDEQIGRGSMGAVYRGTQLMVDRSVAIKLLHPTFAGHDKIQARFEVEAKAIARLNHPNCITLFDFGYSERLEAFYTVVEFIDGIPLADLIAERPPVARVVGLIKQIASALGHAHHHGILHRDLKPENIMLAPMTDGSDIIKVLDFGIAQIMKGNTDGDDDDFEADRLTRVGEVFGTPPYMSPEQTQSSRDLSPAADLYSLGVIFYELIEGRLPFFADAPVEILRMHMTEPPPPMKRTGLADSVRAVVLKMLEKDPKDRPASGNEIVELLDAIPAEDLDESGPAVRIEGDARPQEPTLMSAPPDTGERDGPAPGEASEIYELTDIVAGAQALMNQKEQASRPSTSTKIEIDDRPAPSSPPPKAKPSPNHKVKTPAAPTPDPVDRERITATQFIADGDEALERDISNLTRSQLKLIAGVVVGILLFVGGLSWVVVTYEPFGLASEDDMREVSEIATQHHGTDDAPKEEEPQEPAVVNVSDEQLADLDEESDEDRADGQEKDEKEEDAEDSPQGEAEEEVDEAPAQPAPRRTRRRASPPPEPSPSPAQETSDDDRERPVRLGGTRGIRGVSGDSDGEVDD